MLEHGYRSGVGLHLRSIIQHAGLRRDRYLTARQASVAAVRRLPGYEGRAVAVVEVYPAVFDDTIEQVNITLPKRVLRRLDDLAGARHQSRGAFIAELTMRTPVGGRRPGS